VVLVRSRVPRTGAAFARAGAEVPRVRSRADYDGGARLTRLLAGRERHCRPRRGRRAGRTSRVRAGVRAVRRRGAGGARVGGIAALRLAVTRVWRLAEPGAGGCLESIGSSRRHFADSARPMEGTAFPESYPG
jgi:hypothetical protein